MDAGDAMEGELVTPQKRLPPSPSFLTLFLFACLGSTEVANPSRPGQCFPGGKNHPWVGGIETTEGQNTEL